MLRRFANLVWRKSSRAESRCLTGSSDVSLEGACRHYVLFLGEVALTTLRQEFDGGGRGEHGRHELTPTLLDPLAVLLVHEVRVLGVPPSCPSSTVSSSSVPTSSRSRTSPCCASTTARRQVVTATATQIEVAVTAATRPMSMERPAPFIASMVDGQAAVWSARRIRSAR